jgi:hypothetical protein
MRISVCIEGTRTLSPDGWAIAESHCLPQIAVYMIGGLVLICVAFTILVLAQFIRRNHSRT